MIKNKDVIHSDFPLPQVLVESCTQRQGIVLIVGNRFAQINKVLESMKKRWEQSHEGMHLFVTRDENSELEKNNFQITSYENLSESKTRKKVNESSVVVFEDIQFEDELSTVANLCESGRLVVAHVNTHSITSAMHRIFGLALQTQNPHLLWRIIDGFNLLYSQTRIVNSKMESVFTNEIVLASSEVKKCLWLGNLNEFEDLMKNSGENSGIVTMNQSLLQLIIRRRIEIKTAFEISRDPDDLDHLLKKVGV